MLIAVLLTALVHMVLNHFDWERRLSALPLLYVSMSVFFACLLWLFFFE